MYILSGFLFQTGADRGLDEAVHRLALRLRGGEELLIHLNLNIKRYALDVLFLAL